MEATTNARAVNAVSPAELQRRWRATREAMHARQIDALVVQNSSDWVGGYVRWFSNQPATNGYPTSLVFPGNAAMSLIEQGPFGGVRVSSEAERERTGIASRLTTPSYPSVCYSGSYDAELAVKELRTHGVKRVGLVAPSAMYHSFGTVVTRALHDAGVDVVDATDMVDRIKAIKSEEERGLIRRVAALQDEVLQRVTRFVRPGLRDFEVAAYAQYIAQQLGSEQGIFLCSSAPAGEAATFRPRSLQGRTLQRGDVFSLLVETNGPGGYYAELSRIFVLGKALAELRDAYDKIMDAQRYALSLLKPGASCADIHARHNEYLRSLDLPEERRVNMHGMGYDMVERPLIRKDEDMSLAEDMAIVCHPGLINARLFVHNTDLYLIEAHGASECLHRTPQRIFELDV